MICRKISNGLYIFLDISLAQTVKDPPANSNDSGSIPGSGRPPGDGNCNSLYYYCLENPMEWRSLAGYSLWDCKESDMTEWVGIHIFFSNIFKLIGKIKLYTVQIIFFGRCCKIVPQICLLLLLSPGIHDNAYYFPHCF